MSKAATVARHVLIRVRGDVRETRTFFIEEAKDEVRISDRSEDNVPTIKTSLEGGRAIFGYLLAEGWSRQGAAVDKALAESTARVLAEKAAASAATTKAIAKRRALPKKPILIEG